MPAIRHSEPDDRVGRIHPGFDDAQLRLHAQAHQHEAEQKAVGGTPWTRETQNTGHAFTFSWIGRTWACVQRLKWYYEQYEDGFFTIIDWDGGGRQYVGRFTSEVIPVETGNGMWDVQNVTFEEIPQQQMVAFPSDWAQRCDRVLHHQRFRRPKTCHQRRVAADGARGRCRRAGY
jgi:hypothetical protein